MRVHHRRRSRTYHSRFDPALRLVMPNDPIQSPRFSPRVLAVWAGASTIAGLFFSTQIYLIVTRLQDQPLTWWRALHWGLVVWWLWGALAAAIAWLGRRYPFTQRRWPGVLVLHALGAIAVAFTHVTLATSWFWVVERPMPWAELFRFRFILDFHWNILIYAAILGVVHALAFAGSLRDRQVRASRLEAQLANARLEALRMQLHPHFLFNTLQAIAALIHHDPDAADRMLVRLGDLLRLALDTAKARSHPLADEIAFTRKYLEIEAARFGDRLIVSYDIDARALDFDVPVMLLQPLVENAMRHAVARQSEPCKVVIRAQLRDGVMDVEVADSGQHAGDAPDRPGGLGLRNTNARLRELYDDSVRVTLHRPAEGGCVARVLLPVRGRNDSAEHSTP